MIPNKPLCLVYLADDWRGHSRPHGHPARLCGPWVSTAMTQPQMGITGFRQN